MDPTPRQRGLLSSTVALEEATQGLTDPQGVLFYAEAQQLQSDVQNMWAPPFQAPALIARASALGQAIANQYTIDNPLDVPDPVGVGTPQEEAFSSGDVGTNLSALGSDFASSASALASSSGSFLQTAIKWVAIAAVALLVLDIVIKRNA